MVWTEEISKNKGLFVQCAMQRSNRIYLHVLGCAYAMVEVKKNVTNILGQPEHPNIKKG
jgi:hypothetical protein